MKRISAFLCSILLLCLCVVPVFAENPDKVIDHAELLSQEEEAFGFHLPEPVRIGVARDEAFCFM